MLAVTPDLDLEILVKSSRHLCLGAYTRHPYCRFGKQALGSDRHAIEPCRLSHYSISTSFYAVPENSLYFWTIYVLFLMRVERGIRNYLQTCTVNQSISSLVIWKSFACQRFYKQVVMLGHSVLFFILFLYVGNVRKKMNNNKEPCVAVFWSMRPKERWEWNG